MKKFKIALVFLLVFLTSILSADAGINIELRSTAFFHTSKRFREIYGDVSASYQIEGSTRLCNCYEGWVNFDWFTKSGRSVGFRDPTRVNIANVSLGLKYPFQITEKLELYAGIGPSFSRIWLKNRGQFFRERTSRFAVGVLVKSGLIYNLPCNFFLDLFEDHLYQPDNFHKNVDIGGFKLGGGIGRKF